MDEIVLRNLQMVTAYAREQPEEFYAMAAQNGKEEARKFCKTAEREQKQLESRIKELDNIIRCLYEDRVCGRLTPERYDALASGYEQEQTELKQSLQIIAERMEQMDVREDCIRKFMEQAKAYLEMPKLTPELLRVFIRKIEVFEKLEKYSRTAGNLIVIHYAFQLPEESGMPILEKILPKQAKTA